MIWTIPWLWGAQSGKTWIGCTLTPLGLFGFSSTRGRWEHARPNTLRDWRSTECALPDWILVDTGSATHRAELPFEMVTRGRDIQDWTGPRVRPLPPTYRTNGEGVECRVGQATQRVFWIASAKLARILGREKDRRGWWARNHSSF